MNKKQKIIALLMTILLIITNLLSLGNRAIATTIESIDSTKEEEHGQITNRNQETDHVLSMSQTTVQIEEPIKSSKKIDEPELSLEVAPIVQTEVREGQIIRMRATIKNIGEQTAKSAKLKITAPEGTKHVELEEGSLAYETSQNKEKIITIGDIKPGATITQNYELEVQKGVSTIQIQNPETQKEQTIAIEQYPGDKTIQTGVILTAENLPNEIKSENYTFKVLEGDLKIVGICNVNESEVLKKGRKFTYKIKVENISNSKNLNNVILKTSIPEGIKITDVYYGDTNSLKEKSRENITIDKNNIQINLGKLDSLNAYLQNNQNQSDSPQIVNLRTQAYVVVEAQVENYTGELTLVSTATAQDIQEHYSNIRTYQLEKVDLSFIQKSLENQNIKETQEYTYQFVLENIGKISSIENKIEVILPEGLSFISAKYQYQDASLIKSVADNQTFVINLYELKPGEKLDLSLTVKANLLPSKQNKEVTTVATVEANGFAKIETNKIKAVIQYDEQAHKNQDPDQNTNQDSNNNQGSNKPGSNNEGSNNQENNNVNNPRFDLKLEQYISKVTRTTPTDGTSIIDYNNTKLAKVEVLGKNVNQSNIVVEYKIVVTNEGNIAGYARKIADYLPQNAKFNTEMNQDWYLASNNQEVYNTSLANMLIKPGESKELTLVLSFTITDKNIGQTITNTAEIYESFNEQGVSDVDSTPANQKLNEDDLSQTNLVLSVVTGNKIIMYISIMLIALLLLGFGTYEIKKQVLTIKNK